jgi:hypothetical protein
MLDRIEGVLQMLSEQPKAGRERPELAPELRSFPVGNYLVVLPASSRGHRPGARAERPHGYRFGRPRDLTRLCLRPTTRVHRAARLFIAHDCCRDRTQIYVSSGSVHAFTCEAVASLPELADRAPLAMVVDAFLMRAADDAVGHGNGQHAVPRHEL